MHRATLSLPVVLCLSACGPEAFEMPERIEPEIAPQTPAAFVAACPVDSFIDLDVVDGPGPGYPRPTLAASCEGDELVVRTNGLPHYTFQQVTPNGLSAQDYTYRVPLEPQTASQKTDLPLLGVAAFAINGAPIYGPNEAERPDPYGDPVYNGILDWCQGHTAQRGDYHYHALLVECFYPDLPADAPDPVIGFALDGFPIYGPLGCVDAECSEQVYFESSWRRIGDPSTYAWDNHTCDSPDCETGSPTTLDRCNGHIGPDGSYHYHATDGFPYVLGCYQGEPTAFGRAR